MEPPNVLKTLFNDGELPKVNVEIGLTKETIIDLAFAAIIVAVLLAFLNKYILSKI
ncbi:hypothetical protein Pedsa_0871 [Pseudopedobacter saltans DSM 12145]|uniref:Uncharacterized protein n=1 Tax=Pseudopedobacter saltans (strain ATCC 51119 / DSM 12145 / JCM 21818 / CCUG 39354 / LMG 10337 / NBRC 100064 / NCIMB 13643) TaxID=762903 RepID=F0S9T7_PSESL|nr:hypothetical protein [Pseudopedobacter saltans]ADY51443.1 hypothetical protein Pedsa_0871 [Pseudopedobacter saltans DSM 12145]